MLALVATGRGYETELRDVDEPQPRADEAIVAVRAISLNRGEVAALGRASEGARLGWDVAGEVVTSARDGTGPKQGARAVGLTRAAGWAERVAVRTHMYEKNSAGTASTRAKSLTQPVYPPRPTIVRKPVIRASAPIRSDCRVARGWRR